MKCDKCNKSCQQNSIVISVGEIRICKTCVDNAASGCDSVIINEVLAYINVYRHSSNKRKMREACVGFYNEEEIFNAKVILHSVKPSLFGDCVKRQDSTAGGRTKDEANIEDIYDWFRRLDDHDISLNICAKNLKRVPKFNPEESENTSMLERIIKIEESMRMEKDTHIALIGRTSKLEEKVFNGSESPENKLSLVNDNLNKTESQIVKVSNEVINIDKEVKSQKNTFSDVLKTSLSQFNNNSTANNNNSNNNNRYNNLAANGGNNMGANNLGSMTNNNEQNNEWRVAGENRRRKKAILGTARPIPAVSGSTSKIFGAPPPSRHFVLERVRKEITEDDLIAYINNKNNELEVRTLECLSHEESLYKKFKFEISVEDCKIIYAPDFWRWGTRIRSFFSQEEWRR